MFLWCFVFIFNFKREVEKPTILMSTLKQDVMKALKESGWEKILRNKIYAYLNR